MILKVFTDLIQKLYFLLTETTFLTVCIKPASGQNNRERGETNLLPLRFNGVWQTNVCVSALPAGLECEAAKGGKIIRGKCLRCADLFSLKKKKQADLHK